MESVPGCQSLYSVTRFTGWTKTGYDDQGRAIKTTRYLTVNSKSKSVREKGVVGQSLSEKTPGTEAEAGDAELCIVDGSRHSQASLQPGEARASSHTCSCTQTAYDTADRVTQVTYPNNRAVVAYSYDEAGHQVKAESLWGTGLNEVFYDVNSFDRFGTPTVLTYGNGVTTERQFYDISHRLKRTHAYIGSTSLMDNRYTFDKASNITNIYDQLNPANDPTNNGLENIQYDDLYRITSVDPGWQANSIAYQYDGLGNIKVNGEMGTSVYAYDGSGHAHTQPHAVTAVGSNAYTYDACGNMTTRNTATYGNQSLIYDAQNRLIQVSADGNDVTFGYSAGGTRLWKKVNGQIKQIWLGGLYEEKDGKVLLHVSAAGQLVATFEPETYLACLIENQPFFAGLWHGTQSAARGLFGGGTAPLTIMGLFLLAAALMAWRYNRRRLYLVYGITTPRGSGLALRQIICTTMVGFILLAGIPQQAFAQTGPEYDPVFYYYLNDHLGSSSIMLDRNGEVVQRYGYTPFGNERYQQTTQAFNISNRYTGQVLDEDTGLYYYGARYYDAELGRFIQADTTVPDPGFSQAFNRYAYVYNNPIKFSDPTGQFPFALIAMGIGAIIGGIQAHNNGGNIFVGMLQGAVMGMMSYGFGLMGQAIIPGILGAAMGGALGGAFTAYMSGASPRDIWRAAGWGAAIAATTFVIEDLFLTGTSPGTTDDLVEQNMEALEQSQGSAQSGGTSLANQREIIITGQSLYNSDGCTWELVYHVEVADYSIAANGEIVREVIYEGISIGEIAAEFGRGLKDGFKFMVLGDKYALSGYESWVQDACQVATCVEQTASIAAGGAAATKAVAKRLAARKIARISLQQGAKVSVLHGCFVGNTLIYTKNGFREIANISIGDMVWACDPEKGGRVLCEVVAKFEFEIKQTILINPGPEQIRTTAEHPFWVPNKGWIKAKDLQIGDSLKTYKGTLQNINSIGIATSNTSVYNIEVAGLHTYFVSNAKVLVHNKAMANNAGRFMGRNALRRMNSQVRSIVRELKLTRSQQRQLHDAITGQNMGYHEIKELAKAMF